jgi:inosine-uridine nucleoside N-ribohydrolase
MPAEKLIIDADPGIGDAITIALALSDPNLEVLAVTACGGRTSGEQAFRNLQTVLSIVDPPRWPRLGWSSAPSVAMPPDPHKAGILLRDGTEGLGECETIEAPPHQPTDSFKLLSDLVREYPDQITLLTLGPLTNLFLAQERHADFLPQLKGLICLGGSVAVGGNVTAAAEFNIYADPEAARFVLTYPATKTLVPLDVSLRFGLSFEEYDSLNIDPYTRLGQFLVQTLPYSLRQSRTQLGKEGIELPGIVALAAVSHPRLFEQESLPMDVELSGELTRGMTVFDRRGANVWEANIDVLTGIEPAGVRDYMIRLIRSAGAS